MAICFVSNLVVFCNLQQSEKKMNKKEDEISISGHLNIEDPVYTTKHKGLEPEDGSLKKPSSTLLEAMKLANEDRHVVLDNSNTHRVTERRTSLHDLENDPQYE